jgi:hypothetical protein
MENCAMQLERLQYAKARKAVVTGIADARAIDD